MRTYLSERNDIISKFKNELTNISFFSSHKKIEILFVDVIDFMARNKQSIEDEILDNLGEIEDSNKELQNELTNCNSLSLELEEKNERLQKKIFSTHQEKEIRKKLKNKKIGIIGGHLTDINYIETALKEIESSMSFKKTEGGKNQAVPPSSILNNKYKSCDLIVVITNYTGHGLTRAAEKLSKNNNIPHIMENGKQFRHSVLNKILGHFN